jgi:predicted GTPase
VNDPDLFPENWRRYLMRQLQEKTPYCEVPIRLKFKARERVLLERP